MQRVSCNEESVARRDSNLGIRDCSFEMPSRVAESATALSDDAVLKVKPAFAECIYFRTVKDSVV